MAGGFAVRERWLGHPRRGCLGARGLPGTEVRATVGGAAVSVFPLLWFSPAALVQLGVAARRRCGCAPRRSVGSFDPAAAFVQHGVRAGGWQSATVAAGSGAGQVRWFNPAVSVVVFRPLEFAAVRACATCGIPYLCS
eukprot:15474375-Alexandrium_andersonii.AAC.2